MLVLYNTAIQAIERDKKKQVTKKEFCFLSVGDKFSHLSVFIALGQKLIAALMPDCLYLSLSSPVILSVWLSVSDSRLYRD